MGLCKFEEAPAAAWLAGGLWQLEAARQRPPHSIRPPPSHGAAAATAAEAQSCKVSWRWRSRRTERCGPRRRTLATLGRCCERAGLACPRSPSESVKSLRCLAFTAAELVMQSGMSLEKGNSAEEEVGQ